MFPDLSSAGHRALHAVGACDHFDIIPPVITRVRAPVYLHVVTLVEPTTDHFGIAEVLAPGIS